MTKCSILQCSARKNKNRPQLTLHSLPKNEDKKNKWLDIIGKVNINPHHGKIFICSLHFDPSCFNKTLDIIRLHDDAMPSPFVVVCKNNAKPDLIQQQNKHGSFEAVATSSNIDNPVAETALVKIHQQVKIIKKLIMRCNTRRGIIKNLKDKVRRRDNKIAVLKDNLNKLKIKFHNVNKNS